jgi:hypothetical protein
MSTFERKCLNRETGKIEIIHSEKLCWEDVADSFFERQAEYEARRRTMAEAEEKATKDMARQKRPARTSNNLDDEEVW